MKTKIKMEIAFGLCALALIFFVISNNASITGFVVSPGTGITLVGPADNTQTEATSIYFMFEYSPDIEVTECSVIINDGVAKTANGLLSPYDSRIKLDLVPGTYTWKIECKDTTNTKFESLPRKLTIGEKENPDLRITAFPNKDGFIYEFDLKEGLNLEINNVVPNDVLRAKKDDNSYELTLIRLNQDYAKNIVFADMLITPGDKRIHLNQGEKSSLDFNNDGTAELSITLNQITYRKAFFTVSTDSVEQTTNSEELKAATTETPGIILPPTDESHEESNQLGAATTNTNDAAKQNSIGMIETFLIGLIVVILIGIIATLKKKKETEEKKYVTTLKSKARKKQTKPKRRTTKAKKTKAKKGKAVKTGKTKKKRAKKK